MDDLSSLTDEQFFQDYNRINKQNNCSQVWDTFFNNNSLKLYQFNGPVSFFPNLLSNFDIFYTFFTDKKVFEQYLYPAIEYTNDRNFDHHENPYSFHSMRFLSFLNFAYTMHGKTNFDHLSICFNNNNLFANVGSTRCMYTLMIDRTASINLKGFILKNKNNYFPKNIIPYVKETDINYVISCNYTAIIEKENSTTKDKTMILSNDKRDQFNWTDQLWNRHDYVVDFFRKNKKIYANRDLSHLTNIAPYITANKSKADVIIKFRNSILEYDDIFASILALSGATIKSTNFIVINKVYG